MKAAVLKVQPLSLSDLPTLPGSAVADSRALGRNLLGRPKAFTVSLRSLGPVSVAFMGMQVGHRAADGSLAPPLSGEELTLILGGAVGQGRLLGNAAFVGRLVLACLAIEPSPVVRSLSPGERGIFAALVATILSKAGFPLQVDPRASLSPESARDLDGVSLWLDVGSEIGSGRFRIDLPRAWLGALPAPLLPPEALAALGYLGQLELARTMLPRAAWQGAAVGDVVVFDGFQPLGTDQPWACVFRLGAVTAPATFSADAGLALSSPSSYPSLFRGLAIEEGVLMATSIPPAPTSPPSETVPAGDHQWLGEAPVEVVAECARLQLRSADLLGLVRGSVLPLGRRSLEGITLRVGDRIWARGELVNVDGELALRITELPT